jgi:hypothetical protein
MRVRKTPNQSNDQRASSTKNPLANSTFPSPTSSVLGASTLSESRHTEDYRDEGFVSSPSPVAQSVTSQSEPDYHNLVDDRFIEKIADMVVAKLSEKRRDESFSKKITQFWENARKFSKQVIKKVVPD